MEWRSTLNGDIRDSHDKKKTSIEKSRLFR